LGAPYGAHFFIGEGIMGFFSDLFGRKKEMVSTSAEFAFSLNKTYKLEELKPFLVTPTGYAQHIVGCDVAASPKEGMEEVVCDPRVAASLPDGRKEPLLSFLFSSMAEEYLKKEGRWGNYTVAPVSKVKFLQNPKSCILEFSNPKIWESRSLSFTYIPMQGLVLISALRIGDNKYAMLRINANKTFQVQSISDDKGSVSSNNGINLNNEEGSQRLLDAEYGTNPNNPICLRSISEEYTYLELISCQSNDEIITNKVRLGSKPFNGAIFDIWQISIRNTRLNLNENVVLYMNPYSNKSDFNKVPDRFSFRR